MNPSRRRPPDDLADQVRVQRSALRRDPDHVGHLEELAKLLWSAQDYKEAVQIATRLLRLNPYEPGYRYLRGLSHVALGNFTNGVQDLRDAHAQTPDESLKREIERTLATLGDLGGSPKWIDPELGSDGVYGRVN